MEIKMITLTQENIEKEHLCCAIADKKHRTGVNDKRRWLADRIPEGHIFRKLDVQGKVFIEYAPLEKAWIPVTGENYPTSIACGFPVATKGKVTEKPCWTPAYRMPATRIKQASASSAPKRKSPSYLTKNSCKNKAFRW